MFGPTLCANSNMGCHALQTLFRQCKSWFLPFLDSPTRCANEKIRESRISKREKKGGDSEEVGRVDCIVQIYSKFIELSSFITYSQPFIIKIRRKDLEDVGECIPIY